MLTLLVLQFQPSDTKIIEQVNSDFAKVIWTIKTYCWLFYDHQRSEQLSLIIKRSLENWCCGIIVSTIKSLAYYYYIFMSLANVVRRHVTQTCIAEGKITVNLIQFSKSMEMILILLLFYPKAYFFLFFTQFSHSVWLPQQ